MPLNQPNTSKYKPNPIGAVRLMSRSATRARLTIGGSYFRSVERGEHANLIKIGVFEDGPEGICVIQNMQMKTSEQILAVGMPPASIELFKINLGWNEQIEIAWIGSAWRAQKTGIRWQIAPGPLPFAPTDLGQIKDGLFSSNGTSFKLEGLLSWPQNATLYLRPRTHRYTLAALSDTDPISMLSYTGWDIALLRAALSSGDTWIRMPSRGTAADPPAPGLPGEDLQDDGIDAKVLSAFAITNVKGGSGLPAVPIGLNTGPDRVLIHLNYAEKDDGSLGELNQVFEWIGETATTGSWQRYS